MQQQAESTLSADECVRMEGKFAERTKRLGALFELDKVLCDAANRYNLAAEVVHYGWPHRAD